MSKDIVLHSGREYGDDVHSEIKTFSLVTSPEMAPGFHVLVYAKAGFRYVVAFYHKQWMGWIKKNFPSWKLVKIEISVKNWKFLLHFYRKLKT